MRISKSATKKFPVNEIFYSLQGEGGQMGKASIFIRFSLCNLQCSYCDTLFSSYRLLSLYEIWKKIQKYPSHHIVWTGGEPTLHLTDEIVHYFHDKGYLQSVETNGMKSVPRGIDYVSCSPKPESFLFLQENFPYGVNEWRFPFGEGIPLPPPIETLPPADHYFLSPIFFPSQTISEQKKSLNNCIAYILEHPEWQLSIQLHKFAGFQ